MPRPSGRAPDELRPVRLEPGFAKYAEGSCLARFGDTHVLCTASLEERVPPSACSTSQSMRIWRSPRAARLVTARHERPIRR